MAKEKDLTPQGRHKLEVIAQEVARLEGLLSDLNDLSRPQQYRWQNVGLPQVVERVRELMEPQLQKDGLGVCASRGWAISRPTWPPTPTA